MTNSERLKILVDSGRTVFTPLDMRILWRENAHKAKINTARMFKKNLLMRITRGYYALNKRYNPYELANRIISPSYVSFQAALAAAGVSFQSRGEIGSVALINYHKKAGDIVYTYSAMKRSLFFDKTGIVARDGVYMALPERAVLDSFYFGFLPDLDNPEKLNREYLLKLSTRYPKTVQNKAKAVV
ncbi:MAG: hypothetical protein JW867_00405 [Candidatus Omnitrophica bacterium]|nr:hypothetical protein [Candidatus Omnitrophota bacterium]